MLSKVLYKIMLIKSTAHHRIPIVKDNTPKVLAKCLL